MRATAPRHRHDVTFRIEVGYVPEERIWVARAPALRATCFGRTRDVALRALRRAVSFAVECYVAEGLPLPRDPESLSLTVRLAG